MNTGAIVKVLKKRNLKLKGDSMSEKEQKKVEYIKYQQGDVVMYKLNDKDFEQYSNKDKGSNSAIVDYNTQSDNNPILAFGEVTGHTHQIDMSQMAKNAGVVLHMGYNREAGKDVPEAFEVLNETVELQHEEHDTIALPPGKYVVKIVREFNHITRRAQYVAD